MVRSEENDEARQRERVCKLRRALGEEDVGGQREPQDTGRALIHDVKNVVDADMPQSHAHRQMHECVKHLNVSPMTAATATAPATATSKQARTHARTHAAATLTVFVSP